MKVLSKIYLKTFIFIVMVPLLFCNGCNEDKGVNKEALNDNLIFEAFYITNAYPTYTRAGKEIHAVTSSLMNGLPYYICLEEVTKQQSSGPFPYKVPAGKQGSLEPVNERLNWFDQTTNHNFWAWTLPWKESSFVPESMESFIIYFPIADENSQPENQIISSDYSKNNFYETFFGAVSGPYNYRHDGQYVDLEFYHLVSKIVVDEVYVNFSGLGVYKLNSYDFTLFRIPIEGEFIPKSLDNAGNPVLPYVSTKDKSNGNIKYSLGDKPGNVIYVAPEIDLSKVDFSIKITDDNSILNEYRDDTEYFGNLKNIRFNRTGPDATGGPYDDVSGQSDLTTLHAGEELHLTLVATVGQTPGMGVSVPKWYLKDENPAVSHTRPGVYTQGEMNDVLSGGRSDTSIHLDYYWQLYGSKRPNDNNKYFNIYENLQVKGDFLPCYDPYVIDGMGHLIELSDNPNKIWIENYRNVYIKSGNNLIYIDEEGNISLLNPETFEEIPLDPPCKMAPIGKDKQNIIIFNPFSINYKDRGNDAPRD